MILVSLLGGLIWSCGGVPTLEMGALACDDGEDNDGDELDDCEDPDCWSYVQCLELGDGAVPTAPAGGSSGGGGAAAVDAGLLGDAGTPPVVTDAGAPPVTEVPSTDAGENDCEPCNGSDACATTCPLGPSDDLGVWSISSLEVSAPLWAGPECADRDCGLAAEYVLFVPPLCPCLPDPQVAVAVDGKQIGTTAPKLERQEALWSAPGLELPLREGSTVTFSVYDNDVAGTPLLLYTCSVAASRALLEQGELSCIGPKLLNVQHGVTARLVLP